MKKIDKIRIKNFKAFSELQEFDLKGKNLLVYGNNGSGKSSLYWALYTLLQSSEKTIERVNDYFADYDETDYKTFQSLRNIFSQETDSFVEIELQGEPPIRIEQGNIADVQTSSVKEANKASDFISYELLHNFYNSTHKQQLNLWKVFERDIFPYFSNTGNNYAERLDSIYNRLPKQIGNNHAFYPRTSNTYKLYQSQITNFNQDIRTLIGQINVQSNKILREKFGICDIEIIFEYTKELQWDNNNKRCFSEPEIKLSIKVKKNGIFISNHRPQSFLNEAALTRIAISIRLGALLTRLASSDWKILVLDDMLISLDMANRMIVSKIILEDEDFQDFQKIILTHDKGFFDILKFKTDVPEWEYLEFSKNEKEIGSKPKVKVNKTDLEKAKEFFENSELDACANYLRKEAEKILKRFLGKDLFGIDSEFESLSQLIKQAKTQVEHKQFGKFKQIVHKQVLQIDKLIEDFENDDNLDNNTKGLLRGLKNELLNFAIDENKRNNSATQILKELECIKKRILNPGSHWNSTPLYGQELQEAINIIEQLDQLLKPKG